MQAQEAKKTFWVIIPEDWYTAPKRENNGNTIDRLKRVKVEQLLGALSPSTYFSTNFIEVTKFVAATVSSVIHNLHSTHFDDKSILVLTGPYCSECLSPAKFGRYVKVKETKCSKCGCKIVKTKKVRWG